MRSVKDFCDSRVPEDMRDQMRIECSRRGKAITIVELRPPWNPDLATEWSSTKFAQLRYDESVGTWTLHCPYSTGKWHHYDMLRPSQEVESLLAEIEADPTGIFWG